MITAQQLTAINLRYGTVAKSLKTLAFSDLSAKALYLLGKPTKLNEITNSVAEIIGVRSLSKDLVLNGLKELKADRKVRASKDSWELLEQTKEDIKEQIKASEVTLESVLKRNFPADIEFDLLASWFTDAISDFFVYNGDEWVQSICKGSSNFAKGIKTLDELLDPSIKKHKLNQYSERLKNSFSGFLSSSNKEDQVYIVNIGYAMFSARLVAADVGADPITLEELRNASFIVDTNFFYALQLEKNRLADSLEALGNALKEIGARLLFIHETEEEYKRVWSGKRSEILKLLDIYPNDVVSGADDGFIATAVARGCSNKADFERFFDSVQQIPNKMIEGLPLVKIDDKEVNKIVQKAKQDEGLKKTIQKWCLKMRPSWHRQPKSSAALGHDASLIMIVESEMKAGNKTFVLTLDRSLQACCAERAGNHNLPAAIYLEGLIQILAANNAGPGVDASNFAPLLTSILLKRCIPPEKMYSPQDLHWLYGIQKNIAKFNPEKIKQIALEVTKARLSGKVATDEALQRTVNRLYQEEVQNTSKQVDEATSRAQHAEQGVLRERTLREEAELKLQIQEKENNVRIATFKLIKTLIWRTPASLVVGYLGFYLASISVTQSNPLDTVVGLLTFITVSYALLLKPIKIYLEIRKINQR